MIAMDSPTEPVQPEHAEQREPSQQSVPHRGRRVADALRHDAVPPQDDAMGSSPRVGQLIIETLIRPGRDVADLRRMFEMLRPIKDRHPRASRGVRASKRTRRPTS